MSAAAADSGKRQPGGDRKALLAGVIELVTFLFAAFNNFILKIAPPRPRPEVQTADFSVGIASFVALFVFFAARTAANPSRSRRRRAAWRWVAVALGIGAAIAALTYSRAYNENTFLFESSPGETTVELHSDEQTPYGRQLVRQYQNRYQHPPTPRQLLEYDGNDPERIPVLWTPESLFDTYQRLQIHYIVVVVLLASAVAMFVELAFTSRRK